MGIEVDQIQKEGVPVIRDAFFLFIKDRRYRLPDLVILEETDLHGAEEEASGYLRRSSSTEWVAVVDFAQRSVMITRDSVPTTFAA